MRAIRQILTTLRSFVSHPKKETHPKLHFPDGHSETAVAAEDTPEGLFIITAEGRHIPMSALQFVLMHHAHDNGQAFEMV